jgi:hypothetical protein
MSYGTNSKPLRSSVQKPKRNGGENPVKIPTAQVDDKSGSEFDYLGAASDDNPEERNPSKGVALKGEAPTTDKQL